MSALSEKLKKFLRKEYRDGYLHTHVRGGIAYQIQAIREKFGMTQAEFAERTAKKQSVISRLENSDYGRASVQSLLDIASGLDVALLVRFVSYPEFLRYASNMSKHALQPDTIFESLAAAQKQVATYQPILPQPLQRAGFPAMESLRTTKHKGIQPPYSPSLGQDAKIADMLPAWNN